MSFIEHLRERASLRERHAHHTSNVQALHNLGFNPEHSLMQHHLANLDDVEQKLAPMPRIYDPRGVQE